MKRVFAALLLLSLLFSGCAVQDTDAAPKFGAEHLIIHYIDVDQADGMLLIAGETTVLIDAGNLATNVKMVKYLQRFGVQELDLVVNTHPHMDHMGGISHVMGNFPTKEVWCSHDTYDTAAFQYFVNAATSQGLTIKHPEPGTVYAADGLTIKVLGPVLDADKYSDLNDTSLVLMVQFGEKKFLFTGDMEKYAESQLVAGGTDLKADVLKVGHHGSYSSTSQPFLDAVDPDFGIISCGRNNEYGHPHEAPMNRLEKAEVELYRTDLMGDIVLVTDGKTIAFFLSTSDMEVNGYEKYAA
jgi:competence protein ComEC